MPAGIGMSIGIACPAWAECPRCSAWASAAGGCERGSGVFSSGQGTCWRDALLRLTACMSEVGTSFHIAAGKRFQTSANCLPQ